jgi:hypothetical protein
MIENRQMGRYGQMVNAMAKWQNSSMVVHVVDILLKYLS